MRLSAYRLRSLGYHRGNIDDMTFRLKILEMEKATKSNFRTC